MAHDSVSRIQSGAPGPDDPFWYKDAILYELHVKAFFDSNDDGIGRFPRPDREARLPAGPGRHRHLAAAHLPLTAARRRLRHRRLHERPARLRNARGLRGLRRGRPQSRAARHHRAGHESHLRPASVVPGARAPIPTRRIATITSGATLTSATRTRASSSPTPKPRTGPGTRSRGSTSGIASSATSRTSTSTTPPSGEEMLRRLPLLAGPRRRRVAPGRRPVPLRARRHQLREPAGDARVPQATLRSEIDREYSDRMLLAEANQWPPDVRPYFGDGDEFHMAFHFPLMPRMYMALRQEDRTPIVEILAQTPDIPGQLPVGAVPAQPRRADARDGHRRRARLHVHRVRPRPAHAREHRHPPPPGAAHGQQPPSPGAAAQPAVQHAWHADHLLRRRDRHGRQHLSGRSQRRAHADAVERRPQRRLLAGRPAARSICR